MVSCGRFSQQNTHNTAGELFQGQQMLIALVRGHPAVLHSDADFIDFAQDELKARPHDACALQNPLTPVDNVMG